MLKILLRLKDRILDNATMFNMVRTITDSRSHNLEVIKKELNAKKNEKILDIGCGLGNFSQVTSGKYVGIDTNKSFIKFANQNYANKNKKFMLMDTTKLEFKDKSFDKTLFISMLHHFSDEESKIILREIQRVTKKQLLMLDLLPTDRRFVKFIYRMDRGSNIRTQKEQFRLVKKYFKIVKYKKFDTLMSVHSLILCKPLK